MFIADAARGNFFRNPSRRVASISVLKSYDSPWSIVRTSRRRTHRLEDRTDGSRLSGEVRTANSRSDITGRIAPRCNNTVEQNAPARMLRRRYQMSLARTSSEPIYRFSRRAYARENAPVRSGAHATINGAFQSPRRLPEPALNRR